MPEKFYIQPTNQPTFVRLNVLENFRYFSNKFWNEKKSQVL